MKKIFFSVFTIGFLSLMAFQPNNDPLTIGSPIPHPDVKLKDVSGRETSFKENMKPNGLLVMFSCNTCPVVAKYQTRTIDLANYALDHQIGVILLNANEGTRDDGESFGEMQQYAKDQGYRFAYALDQHSTMANAFGASRTPEVYLFDKNQKLVYHGAIDDNVNGGSGVTRKHAGIAIDEMIAGKEVSTKQTRSVGCGIKRAE